MGLLFSSGKITNSVPNPGYSFCKSFLEYPSTNVITIIHQSTENVYLNNINYFLVSSKNKVIPQIYLEINQLVYKNVSYNLSFLLYNRCWLVMFLLSVQFCTDTLIGKNLLIYLRQNANYLLNTLLYILCRITYSQC